MKVTLSDQEFNLRILTDREFDEAHRLARISGVPLEECPTCHSREEFIPESGGIRERREGSYRYHGEEFKCDCEAQIRLRARYLLANIPADYMTLDWMDDFIGPDEVKDHVQFYLRHWERFRQHGMGLEFGGPLGTGKTFAACHIGKELVKLRQRVYLIYFQALVSAFEKQNGEDLERKMRETTYIILDELLPPTSSRQHEFYATRLEAIIRHRTNHNLPTIITTNLSADALEEYYPRTYSLLAAKQERIDMSGVDARKNHMAQEVRELIANEETRPIS